MPIEYTIIISFVSVVCTVIGVSIGLGNLRRNSRLDDRHDSAQFIRVEAQLGYISDNVNKIVTNIDSIINDIKEHRDRILLVEQEVKQARKEITEIAGHKHKQAIS